MMIGSRFATGAAARVRLRRFTARSALFHAAAALALLVGVCARRDLRESRLPQGVVGGEGIAVALGKVSVRCVAPDHAGESTPPPQEKTSPRPKIITGRGGAQVIVAVPVSEDLPADLRFEDNVSDFLSPSQLAEAGVAGARPGESRAGVETGVDHATCLYPYQVRYAGGDWNPDPTALPSLMVEVARGAKLPTSAPVQVVHLGNLARHLGNPPPFLYLTGHGGIDVSDAELAALRRYLGAGGFLIVDDCQGFDPAIRAVFARLYPNQRLERVPAGHRVYRSYYPLGVIQGGNVRVQAYDEGFFVGGRLAVFYSRNDLGCAWERTPDGQPVHPCHPGGEPQREWAFKMGVNLMVYAFTARE